MYVCFCPYFKPATDLQAHISIAAVFAYRNTPSFFLIIPPAASIMALEQKDPTPSPAQGVGPTYRSEDEKPTATVSKEVSYENVHILSQTPQLIALLT